MRRVPSPVVAALLLAACARREASVETKGAAPQVDGERIVFPGDAPQVASFSVTPAAHDRGERLAVTGRLVWDEDATVRVFAPVGGRVTRVLRDVGRRVEKGEPLAAIASPDLGQAQADARRASADLVAAERAYARVSVLAEHGASARKELEQAEADRERARAEAERARARLALLSGAGELGAVDQAFVLRAPLSGVVVERALNPGQEVRADAAAPLFVISDPARLWVLLDAGERDLGALLPGAPLAIRSPAFPGRTFDGTLRVVGASLDPATRTVHARGAVDNRGGLLKSEMYVSVELLRAAGSGVLVPARAVVSEGGEHVVFVEESRGRYRRVRVAVGRERDGLVPVLTGLAERSPVVVDGTLLLESAWNAGRGAA